MKTSLFLQLDMKVFAAARKIAHCKNRYSTVAQKYEKQLRNAIFKMEKYLAEEE